MAQKSTKRVMNKLERTYRDKIRWLTTPGREARYAFIRKEDEAGRYVGYIVKPIKQGVSEFKDIVSGATEELGIDEAGKRLAKLEADGYHFVVR